jgi:multiple sugar transport system substrate-binding protein
MAHGGTLNGIAWNHSRGYLPLVATAQRFMDRDPGVTIDWQKRSLQAFADEPIERLAERFDLIVIDHPFAGYAAARPTLVPLDEHLPDRYLADQAANSVGPSHASYNYGGHQWALAIDAAAPVSSWRPDLLARYQVELPRTWEDLLALARRGLVALPAIPIDSLMGFYMLCLALGEELFICTEAVVSREIGVAALEAVRELVTLCAPACLERNPIQTYEVMVGGDDIIYCPFAYGYVNYARPEYAEKPLAFGGLVTLAGRRLRSTLGGTGLAISHRCRDLDLALDYVQFVASPESQTGLYAVAGGQPGHRRSWLDPDVNRLCRGYFRDTLPTLDEAYLRPRYDGYIPFQDRAGPAVHAYLRDGGDPSAVLDQLNRLYRESRADG